MRANPLPLIGGFYADETRPWSQQDICNYLPVSAESEGTRTPTIAKTPPGLSPFARISGDPSRGVYSAEDRLFTVMGNTLYQVTTTDSISLGSISGSSRVRFAHNQITGGNQVLIVNGSAGWVWNTNTSTLTLITDTGYPGAINARFIDGYLVQIEPARRFAFHSDLADALSYNTLDRFTSEVSPDLLVSMAVSNNELILFSERTAEFFENTGATQQPFRSKRISFNRGCAGRFAAIEMDNSVFWLGDDGSFYRLDGYTPLRISTRPIEQAIRGLNWDGAFAFVWKDSGHSVCYWTFPGGLTFGFDASQGKWHRRASYGFGRWRVQDMTYWQNRWIASDFQKGRLWSLEWGYPWEFDQEFVSELTSPVIHDNQSRVLMPRLEVIMDTGMPEVAVRDWEVNQATLSITGNVPDGIVGAVVSTSYTVSGGVPPYVVSVSSGTFPPGLTLSSAGVVSGSFTTAGSYSWVVQVVDGDGDIATVPDSSVVTQTDFVLATGSANAILEKSSDGGLTWPGTVDSGGETVTLPLIGQGGNRVFRYGYASARVTTDAVNFSSCTGLGSSDRVLWSLYTGNEWVCRKGNSMFASANGIDFSPRTIPTLTGSFPYDDHTDMAVAKLGSIIVAGVSNTAGIRVIRSGDNGSTWTGVNPAIVFSSICATGTRFIGFPTSPSGSLYQSTDGITWTVLPTSNKPNHTIKRSVYIPSIGRVVAGGSGNAVIWYSDNEGVNWTFDAFVGSGSGYVQRLIYAFGRVIGLAVTDFSSEVRIATSTNGAGWTERFLPASEVDIGAMIP